MAQKLRDLVPEARCCWYSFFAGAMRRSDHTFRARLRDPEYLDLLSNSAQLLGGNAWFCAVEALGSNTRHWSDENWDDAFDQVIGHNLRGPVPAYECEYGRLDVLRLAEELSDLAGFYSAFGLRVAKEGKERADYIGVELEFMVWLCAKQARESLGDGRKALERVAVVKDAQRKFLRDHLGAWGPAFAKRLERCKDSIFFSGVGNILSDFLSAECRKFAVKPGPSFLALRPSPDPESLMGEMQCGSPVPIPGAEGRASQDEMGD